MLKRMAIGLKASFGRKLSNTDFLNLSDSLIRNPPLPKEWGELVAGYTSKSGVSLLDYWRNYFKEQLADIASESTVGLQKSTLLRKLLVERDWSALHAATKDAKHIGSWEHYVEGVEWAKNAPKEEWRNLLLQRWLMAILTDACLTTVGSMLSWVDDIKILELELYCAYDKDIKTLDISFMEMVLKAVDEHRDDDALYLADVKDDVINGLIKEQYGILALIGEDLAYRSVDVEDVSKRMTSLQNKKEQLAKELQGDALRETAARSDGERS